jgi:hypothetical protein
MYSILFSKSFFCITIMANSLKEPAAAPPNGLWSPSFLLPALLSHSRTNANSSLGLSFHVLLIEGPPRELERVCAIRCMPAVFGPPLYERLNWTPPTYNQMGIMLKWPIHTFDLLAPLSTRGVSLCRASAPRTLGELDIFFFFGISEGVDDFL